MRYGVREVCDVMVKANATSDKYTKGQPICHFDSLKTSSLEQAATTVYAQGGQGAPRLIAWDGEKVVTFTMEDALISPLGVQLLTGADLIQEPKSDNAIYKHVTTPVTVKVTGTGETATATLSYDKIDLPGIIMKGDTDHALWGAKIDKDSGEITGDFVELTISNDFALADGKYTADVPATKATGLSDGVYLIDGYVKFETANTIQQIDIEPNKFAGTYYFEGSTLWRDINGQDHAAEFIIPKGKIQSNFTFTMADTGDPSTFTFTVDALPGYIFGNLTKKVNAAIQIVENWTAPTSGE